MRQTDTITAIATSSTNGGISVIRISGEDSLKIIDKIFQSKNGKKQLSKEKSHTIHYGFICDEGKVIDEVIVLLMMEPNSYTKEDVVEIDCHGGALTAKTILEVIIKNGARIAEPGEFTKRAFLNGRIDLTQAEAVIDIINAKNKYALESSISQLRGSTKNCIISIREKMVKDIAYIEAALDDPEHISLDGFAEELKEKVEGYLSRCEHLLENSENGRIIKEGIKTVIVGKPNVGKSSLMNVLLRQDRAIVTEIPGTTRDVLEEEVRIGEVTLRIMDTAGIRKTEDKVEKIGIDRAKSLTKEADCIIAVFDASTELDENDREILEEIKDRKGIILLNKSDLQPKTDEKIINSFTDKIVISFSAKEKEGLEKLEEYLQQLFYENEISFNDEVYISSMRQKEALLDTVQSLQQVLEGIEMGMSEDFLTIDLVNAYEALGKIVGETIEDDIVDTIFREFCMGK